jgi:hypothetical protein
MVRATMPAPQIPGEGRPPPPADLSPRERAIWTSIVDSRPAHYFDAGSLILLSAYCTNAWQCELLAREVRLHPNIRLIRAEYRCQVNVVAMLAHKLRISKLSSRGHQSVEANETKGAPSCRLWAVPSE